MASEMLSAEQANEHLFEKLIESLRETGILSSHHASSSFVVYAHDSTLSLDAAQPAHATTAKWIIRQLRSLYTRTLSDRYPAPLFESRADDHDSCHNIVANQACLIPGFQRLGGSGQIGTVDKAIICISPRLRLYLGTQFAKSYIKSVRAKCLEYQNCPREQIHVSMRRLVEESCEDPNFHHVLTEVGLLTAEKDNARQTPRTILLTFDSGPSEIPYFSKSDLQIVFPTHGVSKYASFFKLLRRLYEREASIIAIYEEAYKKNETTQDTEEAAFRAGVAGILYGIHNEIHMLSGHHSRQATNKHVTTIDVGHEFHSLGQRFEEQSRAQLAAFEAHADFNRQALLMLAKRSSDVERPADLTLETMQRLVARQDELQNGLAKRDQMQELLSASMPPTAPSRFECKCVPYKQTEAWEVQLGLSTVSLMRKRDFQHRPQCRYFKAATHRPKTSQSAKARITWFSKVLDIALTATYFRCQGAGGFSVSPRLAYHSMVDEMTSPSFRVLYTLQSYIAYARDRPKSFTEPLAAKVVDLALNKLQEIFRCRRASPTDVNSFNETLLHRFVNLFFLWSESSNEDTGLILASELIRTHGVPVAHQNKRGRWPLHSYSIDYPSIGYDKVHRLLIPTDDEDAKSSATFDASTLRSLIENLGSEQVFCNMFDVGSLSRAIICKEPDVVYEMVKLNPGLVDDTPPFGFLTHLHLALSVGSFRCFRALIAAVKLTDNLETRCANQRLRGLLEATDKSSGIGIAETVVQVCQMSQNSFARVAGWFQGPVMHSCWYAGALALPFANNCAMRPRHLSLENQVWDCRRCPLDYFKELRRRRQTLEKLASYHFGLIDSARYGLDQGQLLDRHYASVIRRLRELGVSIPNHLVDANSDDQLLPLYHGVLDDAIRQKLASSDHGVGPRAELSALKVEIAHLLFKVGFLDINAPFSDGLTLLEYLILGRSLAQHRPTRAWETITWLVEHGSDVKCHLSNAWKSNHPPHCAASRRCVACRHQHTIPRTTIAHMLAGFIGFSIGQQVNRFPVDYFPWHNLQRIVLPLKIKDETACICSPGGRTPLTYFILDLFSVWPPHEEPDTLSTAMSELIRYWGCTWSVQTYQQAFRLLTFEAFWLEHTCDKPWDDGHHSATDSSRKRDLDAHARFEEFAADFHAFVAHSFNHSKTHHSVRSYDEAEASDVDYKSEKNEAPSDDGTSGKNEEPKGKGKSKPDFGDPALDEDDSSINARESLPCLDCAYWRAMAMKLPMREWLVTEWARRIKEALAELNGSVLVDQYRKELAAMGVRLCERPGNLVENEEDEEGLDKDSWEYWAQRFDEI